MAWISANRAAAALRIGVPALAARRRRGEMDSVSRVESESGRVRYDLDGLISLANKLAWEGKLDRPAPCYLRVTIGILLEDTNEPNVGAWFEWKDWKRALRLIRIAARAKKIVDVRMVGSDLSLDLRRRAPPIEFFRRYAMVAGAWSCETGLVCRRIND